MAGKSQLMVGVPPGCEMRFAIGEFHIHAHVDQCYPNFSSTYMKGACHQGGEIVETIWPTMNEFSGSTQESSTELLAKCWTGTFGITIGRR